MGTSVPCGTFGRAAGFATATRIGCSKITKGLRGIQAYPGSSGTQERIVVLRVCVQSNISCSVALGVQVFSAVPLGIRSDADYSAGILEMSFFGYSEC